MNDLKKLAEEVYCTLNAEVPRHYHDGTIEEAQKEDVEEIRLVLERVLMAKIEWPSDDEIRGAVARGWCSDKNSHKEMDVDLALAISDEISQLRDNIRIAPVQPLSDEELDRLELRELLKLHGRTVDLFIVGYRAAEARLLGKKK